MQQKKNNPPTPNSGKPLAIPEQLETLFVPLKDERKVHQEAFLYWLNDGFEPRTMDEVRDIVHVTHASLMKWKKKYDWEDRRYTLLQKVAEHNQEKVGGLVSDATKDLMAMVDFGIKELTKAIKAGNVKWTGADIKRLVEAKLLLLGQPTERVENLNLNFSEVVIHDAESVKLATALFERLGLGEGDAGRPS
jgi:hypothetical protein